MLKVTSLRFESDENHWVWVGYSLVYDYFNSVSIYCYSVE